MIKQYDSAHSPTAGDLERVFRMPLFSSGSCHSCSTQQHSLDQLSTQAGALPLPSNSFTVRWHSGHQAEPQHASIPSLKATGGHCDSGALNLSDVGAID